MLDVDGQIISSSELIARVEQLIGSARERGWASVPLSAGSGEAPNVFPERASPLQSLSAELQSRTRVRQRRTWRGFAEQVSTFAAEAVDVIQELSKEVSRLVAETERLHRQLDVLQRQNIGVRIQAAEEANRRHQFERETPTREDFAIMRSELATVLQRLGATSGQGAVIDYAGFEDRFRGKSEELREAQRRYVGLFPDAPDSGLIVDFGCGRGEMVSLLTESGHNVVGVDTDPGMVEVCRAKGLRVVQDDGLHYLEGVALDSLKGIFCAQVIEHMLTSEIERLIRLAHERLRPSGVLVVETINPRSLYALGDHFLADTTHVRPVHPETLRYICEQIGFKRVELEETSPHPLAARSDDLADGELGDAVAALLRSVFGYQDYLVVATK